MTGMIISYNAGDIRCETKDELEKAFWEAVRDDNEIWISEDGGYPCMGFIIAQNEAAVNYFERENGYMSASLGDTGRDETVESGQFEVAGYQLIPTKKALECALEFFDTKTEPKCIEWEEL